ncbi:uncharacterized protein LOC115887413 [Sitophilus oryzae]|uniref:Uncharacterized protein LOC115887413 n=1 Tax=Sitophilus oryzae TaxID=7048 RepID=A0A6J2YHD5_SITOR|nr:uncharacterized protein LOC115887413 [Sitophilus oryzae]
MGFDDAALIELVEAHPCLYDKENILFKNKQFVENTWDKIATILNTPADLCIQRWVNLRHRYTKEKRIAKTIPSGSSAAGKIWEYYTNMSFLDNFIVQRNTSGNIKKCHIEEAGPSSISGDLEDYIDPACYSQQSRPSTSTSESTPSDNDFEEGPVELSAGGSQLSSVSTKSCVQIPMTRKRQKSSSEDIYVAFKNSCEAIHNHLEAHNEDMIFGQGIGATLSKVKNPVKSLK